MYFIVKCEKKTRKTKVFENLWKNPGPSGKTQEPKIRSKNELKILGENPRSGNAKGDRVKFTL